MTRPPGIYLGMTNEEYHADPAIGSSGIKMLLDNPYRLFAARNPEPIKYKKRTVKESIALKFGTAYHTLILEPEKFNYKIKFGVDQSAIRGTLGEGEYERLQTMRRMLFRRPKRALLLSEGISEVSFFWIDEATGIMCKVRFDRFASAWILDLKTTRSVADDAIDGEQRKRGWPLSGAMYSIAAGVLKQMIRDGYQMPPEFDDEFISTFIGFDNQIFVFLAQEKEPPYMVRAKALTPYHAASGRDDFRRGLKLIQAAGGIEGFADRDYPDIEDMT